MVEAVKARPDLALWVRRHPSEGAPDDIAALAHPRIRVSTRDIELPAMLQACDEVVVTVSTVGLEASLAGRAVTQVRGSILDSLSPYLSMGVADREVAVDRVAEVFGQGRPQTPSTRAGMGVRTGESTDRLLSVLSQVQGAMHG